MNSKWWKKHRLIKKYEQEQDLHQRAKDYAEKNDLDGVSAPRVNDSESVMRNTQTLGAVLMDVANQCDTVSSEIRSNEHVDIETIGDQIHILQSWCRRAIAKIETGW